MADGVLENVPIVGVKRTFPRAFGRYILEKSLSRGGMGEVFLAVAKGVGQRCVIKTIRGDLTGDEEFVGRFADEAKIMMRIDQENIIRVFDAGKVGTDYYIAMEYVHGRDLGDVLDRAYERGEPMPTQLGLYVAQKLLEGLDYAHKLVDEHGRPMGIVHRDISPQNVLVGFDGAIKLIDFGLARTDLLPARTQGALAVGKYGYMSPEQARHEKIDGRADIYSTGVMLFEVFTGDRLVDEQDQATLWTRVLSPKHRKPSTVVPTLPPEIDELVMTAVAVKSEDRFGDAKAMRDFVQSLRTEKSNRDDLVRYLKYLYPKVDFAHPPLPDFSSVGSGTEGEKSMIIATSREGAMSVFGRGELPIEWTTQIDAAELQSLFQKQRRPERAEKRDRDRDKNYERDVKTDANIHAEPPEGGRPAVIEATWVKSRATISEDKSSRRVPVLEQPSGDHQQTQIAELPPEETVGGAETRYTRAPRVSAEDMSQRAGVDVATEHTIAALGSSRVMQQFRDDEMTVMMDAPPRSSLVRPTSDDPTFGDEDTRDVNSPTRLSATAVSGGEITGSTVPMRGRAIQEKNTRTNLRDRTSDDEKRRGKPIAVGSKQNKIAVHRVTVPSDASPVGFRRGDATLPPAGQPESTEPENNKRQPPIGLLPGIILIGLAVLITLLVMLLLRV